MKTPESVQTISPYRFAPYLLVAAGLAVSTNGLSSPFIYDDIPSIVENRDIRQLWPPHWAALGSQTHAAVNSRPVVSLSFALVIAGHMLLQRLGQRDRGSAKWLIPLLVLFVAAGLGYRTSLRNEYFHRELSIWHQTVEVVPQNPRAHHNLAHALQNSGRTAAAIKHYRIALGLKPDYADAHNNLANALKAGGDIQAAIVHYHKALAIHPDFAAAHNNLGNALKVSGDIQAAIVHYHKALQINRDYADAHNNLGNALALTGNLEEAILHYQNALKLQPNFVQAHYNLDAILQTRGELQTAIDHYRQALRWQPDFAAARQNLDIALATLRGAGSKK